jgi:hypothetical protein
MEASPKREVYWSRDSMDAALAKNLLESSGIEAFVVGGMLEACAPEVPALLATPRVWVAVEDFDRAKDLVDEWVAKRNAESHVVRAPWTCAACGEKVTASFDICWNCQAERPAD